MVKSEKQKLFERKLKLNYDFNLIKMKYSLRQVSPTEYKHLKKKYELKKAKILKELREI